MYKEFYGLRANPFNVNPDPRYLFLTRHTEEALACLTYGIQSRKGFVLLTGEVGTGKTTLINKLLEWLRLQQVATAFIFNSRLNTPQFLDYMMADFGIPCDSKAKSQILLRLYNWLLDRYRAGETAVLIVDEAQNLSEEVLEEIRMLTNLETFTEKLLQIVLVGQPELEQKLKQPQLRQLRQRLTLRAKTHALTLDETKAYVQQRLRIAGSMTPEQWRKYLATPPNLGKIKSVKRRIETAPGQWRTVQVVEDMPRLERITRAYRNRVLASFGFTAAQIKADDVAIDAGAAGIGAGQFKGTVEPTVDATHYVDGGCRATSADGSRWECYIGEAAVRQRIIGQAFLGQYVSAPGVG